MTVVRRNLFVFVCLALLTMAPAVPAQQVLDRIVAVVDDRIILHSELYQHSYSLAIQLGVDPQRQPEKMERLRQQTLDNLITQKVLYVKAKEDSITVNEKQVDAVLQEQINQMVNQLGSQERVEEYFGMSVNQIKREFRDEVRERLMVESLQNLKFQEIQITRKEVEDFYRAYRDSLPEMKASVHISHILRSIEPSEATVRAVRTKAEELLQRIKRGEDISELAREYSEDPGSANRGGETGFIERGDFVRQYEEVAFNMQPGEVSDIVRTRYGFHIIKLLERRGEKVNTRHILLRLDTSPEDEQATVERLRALRERILADEITFAEAAEKHSDDETTASAGGDLGWFELDQFQMDAFRQAVSALKPGEISEPVKTRFGYHLVKLHERQEARKLHLQEDWQQVKQMALNMKRQREFQKWVERIKQDFYIEVKI